MEALVIQELNPGPSIAWYFWHNNYQSATRLMNEWEIVYKALVYHALPWLRTVHATPNPNPKAIVSWVDETDFEYFCNALQQYMDYTSL